MPDIPDKQEREDSKEIRLFGEKSIKEEAYRQKIIQLEKEIMRLESILEHQREKKEPENVYVSEKDTRPPEYLEGLFYETAASLDERVKKYQNMLEIKARDISERLSIQAQNLIEHEKIHRHVVITKRVLIVLSLLTISAIVLSVFSIFAIPRLTSTPYQKRLVALTAYEKPEYIKQILQESGFYNKQYTIISLNYFNQTYKGVVELHFKPYNSWTLKKIAADIIDNFKGISSDKSIELDFIYEDKAYSRVGYSYASDETRYEFLTPSGDKK